MVKLLDSVVTLSKNHSGNITIKFLSVHAISMAKRRLAFRNAYTCQFQCHFIPIELLYPLLARWDYVPGERYSGFCLLQELRLFFGFKILDFAIFLGVNIFQVYIFFFFFFFCMSFSTGILLDVS